MDKFIIVYDFMVIDMDEISQVLIAFEKLIFTTTRAMIDVPASSMSF